MSLPPTDCLEDDLSGETVSETCSWLLRLMLFLLGEESAPAFPIRVSSSCATECTIDSVCRYLVVVLSVPRAAATPCTAALSLALSLHCALPAIPFAAASQRPRKPLMSHRMHQCHSSVHRDGLHRSRVGAALLHQRSCRHSRRGAALLLVTSLLPSVDGEGRKRRATRTTLHNDATKQITHAASSVGMLWIAHFVTVP